MRQRHAANSELLSVLAKLAQGRKISVALLSKSEDTPHAMIAARIADAHADEEPVEESEKMADVIVALSLPGPNKAIERKAMALEHTLATAGKKCRVIVEWGEKEEVVATTLTRERASLLGG